MPAQISAVFERNQHPRQAPPWDCSVWYVGNVNIELPKSLDKSEELAKDPKLVCPEMHCGIPAKILRSELLNFLISFST